MGHGVRPSRPVWVHSGWMDDGVPEALGRLDRASLIGPRVAQASSRVEEAGGRLRAVQRDWAVDLSHGPDGSPS